MQLKPFLLSALALFVCSASFAQDKIYKTNGEVIEAKVREVNSRTIKYSRADNATGPQYSISRGEVDKIKFENGTEELMSDHRLRGGEKSEAKSNVHYGSNIIAFSPLEVISDDGVALGISYERMLDKKGIISFYLPVAFGLSNGSNSGDFATAPFGGNYYYRGSKNMIYAYPGFKIYPTGSRGVVRYGVGASLAIAKGEQYVDQYDPYGTAAPTIITLDKFQFGLIVNNSLNITPTPHLYLGMELGLGVTYINRVGGINQNTTGLARFGFSVGYRF